MQYVHYRSISCMFTHTCLSFVRLFQGIAHAEHVITLNKGAAGAHTHMHACSIQVRSLAVNAVTAAVETLIQGGDVLHRHWNRSHCHFILKLQQMFLLLLSIAILKVIVQPWPFDSVHCYNLKCSLFIFHKVTSFLNYIMHMPLCVCLVCVWLTEWKWQ